ncbi:MAG: hypothetical protein KatS3mg031_1130 [Chitinophagales bacterium]|nr:MAG: hypothetical protein KatS3mg031_1130 [Chitinophagales bacterium]
MGKTLILLVSVYPYGLKESYLKEELEALSAQFDKIYIVATEVRQGATNSILFALPPNAESVLFSVRYGWKEKIRAVFSLLSPPMRQHLKRVREHYRLPLSRKILSILLSYEALDCVFRKKLEQFITSRGIQTGALTIYTYWLTGYTYSAARLKEKNKHIQVISRAHAWDVYFERHNPPYLPLRDYIVSVIDRVITISENGRQYLLAKAGKEYANKVVTHRLAVARGRFRDALPPHEGIHILSLSFLSPIKRVELIIEALALLNIRVIWFYIGDSKDVYALRIKALAEEKLGNHAHITYRFLGEMDKSAVYNFLGSEIIDVIVNTSFFEGLPVSIMEAMAHGIPAIAPDIGAMNEIIEHGRNGFLMSERPDAAELAAVMEKFYRLTPAEKNSLRIQAFQTWEERFNPEKNYKQLMKEFIR